MHTRLQLAVIGAGPVGLALALHAARTLPAAEVTLFDARPLDADLARDTRTLALALGSVQWLQQLGAWPEAASASITTVHVSQTPPSLLGGLGAARVRLEAAALGVPRLGAVLPYAALLQALQQAWLDEAASQQAAHAPQRLHTRFGTPVVALKPLADGVEVDAGVAECFDLAVVAEGGMFADQSVKPLRSDYGQTAWVGSVVLEGGTRGMAFERFTRHGPAALLPLPAPADGKGDGDSKGNTPGALHAALVWCVDSADDPVRELDSAQRLAVLNTVFPPEAGRLTALSPLKDFPLGLNAERSLVQPGPDGMPGRVVRIGNAAQTLHPVAGQGLNLGLRDAHTLVDALRWAGDVDSALRRVTWQRAPDRWSTIVGTDFLARSFTWQLPGAASARALGLAALQALPPLRHALARQMMFGIR
jgi:2-octaprenyl-6-methoxyphenol hydroxylase